MDIVPNPLLTTGQSGTNQSTENRSLSDAVREIAKLRDTVSDLQGSVKKQASVLHSLFDLIAERTDITEAELLMKFQQLELASKEKSPTVMCENCSRPINLRHNRCLYCETERVVTSVFDLLQ